VWSSSCVSYAPRRWPNCGSSVGEAIVCAFNELRPELIRALYCSLGNFEDAQDVAQETFLKCWRSRASIERVRNLRAWIFRVGWNSAKDMQRNAFRRRSRPLSAVVVADQAVHSSPQRTVEERELAERLRQALVNLRRDEREVFLLRQNGQLTYDQIASLRRIPVGTTKSQMHAAITKLRRVLREK
jgi:RNA polymerase sigma-70 factor (ECF subfamily)